MKFKFLVPGLLACALATRANAASTFYVNDGVVVAPPMIPPQVDATNFVNNNYFSINFTNFFFQFPYDTANTLNFTNNGMMIGNSGFRFDTKPTGAGVHRMAANFVNNGSISAGSAGNTNAFFGLFLLTPGLPKLEISATNISLRSSTNIVGVDGLMTLKGKNVDLNRAFIAMEGFEQNPDALFAIIAAAGLSEAYWGVGTIALPFTLNGTGNFESPTPFSPPHLVNFPNGFIGFQQLVLGNPDFYVDEFIIGTNRFVNAVFVNNTNASIEHNVYFPFTGISVVEWLGRETNGVTGAITTNRLYLTDDFGTFGSNFVVTNISYYTAAGTATPANYTFSYFNPFLFGAGPAFPPTSPVGVFDPVTVTNVQYAALGALFSPTSVRLDELPIAGRFLTNLPGRIEVTADSVLDLNRARIAGLNYLSLKATNHVASANGAKISVPFSDFNLATTNGNLAITNLLYPVVHRFTGEVDLWSGRWTNDFGGFQTRYSVLLVDSRLNATDPSRVQDLNLRSTNVVISDVLNVIRNLLIDAQRLTITTNQPPRATTRGELNLQSSDIIWSSSLPRLQYLTNSGQISTLNALFLGGRRTSPFYNTTFDEPYEAFVNTGVVTSEGTTIWAKYFENSGFFSTGLGFGSISLDSTTAILTNGTFLALKGEISISSGSLVISNHLLQAGRNITLSITNSITDNVTTNSNTWLSGRGLSMLQKPAIGDLLGTTLFTTLPVGVEGINRWAAEDRGCSNAGFTNNAAIGRMILDGGEDSLATFTGTGANNAIYIDYLELRNSMTNRDIAGNFTGLQVDPNMKVYFGDAVAAGASIAEKLDGQNGGRFCWVSTYAGRYSGTNVVYPDGTTNFFNAALVASCNLDSDGDGMVNCSDTTPILRPQDLALTVSLVNAPTLKAQVSWNSGPFAANYVYYKTNSSSSPWLPLTNFVSGPTGGRVSVVDAVNPTNPKFYRVRVDPQQP